MDTFDPARTTWVLDRNSLRNLTEAVVSAEEVVADLETTGLDEYARGEKHRNGGVPARIVLGSLTLPQPEDVGDPITWIVPLSHPDSPWLTRWRAVLRRVAQTVLDAQVPLVNQNVKFDSRWVFAHTGVDLSSLIGWDTQVSSHLLDENSSAKLKDRAPATFGIQRWDDWDLTVPGEAERVPLFDLGLYAARDTYWTWRLARLHRDRMFVTGDEVPADREEVEDARLGRLSVWCAMPTVATLAAVEQRGIRLDVEWTRNKLAEDETIQARCTDALASRYPLEGREVQDASFAPTSHWFADWSQAAVNAGDLRIAAMTPTGKPQWTKAVLVRQARGGSEVAQTLLDLRGAQKRTEFLRAWLGFVTAKGLIHTNYNVGAIVTGRLSSDSPNMQQVTKALRAAFVADPGYLLVDLDYGQIEMRVAAYISGCEPLREAFERGVDTHRMLAARITSKAEGLITAWERQKGKSANFGLLFGMGINGFREYAETNYDVSYTPEEAARIHQAFFDTWVGMREWHLRAVNKVRLDGQIVSPLGRVRRLPGVHSGSEYLVGHAERAAINSPVQGFASDLMQMAAASIEGNLPGHDPVRGASIVATVHDSIVAQVPEDTWKETVVACAERMLGLTPVLRRMECGFDIPLVVEATCGTRWGVGDVGTITFG